GPGRAGGGELAAKVHDRDGMACCQHHELRGASKEEGVSRDQERFGPRLGKPRKSRLDVAIGAGLENLDFLTNTLRSELNIIHFGDRIVRVRSAASPGSRSYCPSAQR